MVIKILNEMVIKNTNDIFNVINFFEINRINELILNIYRKKCNWKNSSNQKKRSKTAQFYKYSFKSC